MASEILSSVNSKLSKSSVVLKCVSDVSDGHTVQGYLDGRAQKSDGLELLVLLVDDAFRGKRTLERHRMVNQMLDEEFNDGRIHSIQVT